MSEEIKEVQEEKPKRGRPTKKAMMSEVIDKADARSAQEIFDKYPPEAKASIYIKDVDKKNKYLGSCKIAEMLEIGGFEDYLSETYGGGSYALTVRNERGQAMRNLTFEVAGPKTPLLLSLVDGIEASKQPLSAPSVTSKPDRLSQLESELDEFKRQKERDDLMGAFQAQFDELKRDLKSKTDWASVLSAAGSTLGAIIPLLKTQQDTENPVIMKLLEDKLSGADVVRSVKSFMEALKDLMPQAFAPVPPPPPGGTSPATNSIIDSLVQALAPSILQAVNKQPQPQPSQSPVQSPVQSHTPDALEQIRQMVASRTNPAIVAEALVGSFASLQVNGGLERYPELLRLQSAPEESIKTFFNRLGDFSSLKSEEYRDEIIQFLFSAVLTPPQEEV